MRLETTKFNSNATTLDLESIQLEYTLTTLV